MEPLQLAHLFGLPDLPQRLAAVERTIAEALGRDGEMLAPAALRVAGSGGKALRPLLAIVSAAAGDRDMFDQRVASVAAAVELVQVGSLVHDDILDRATTRRGRPTINAVEGIDHAVLAGDYILARAAALAVSVSREAGALVAETLGVLCEGQALEMRDAFDPDRSVEAHLRSVHGKTAALFACACRIGAVTAGLPDRDADALARYGEAFGMGFQVLDDVLDLLGDPDRLGKPTGLDIASGVYTLPVLTALDGPHGGELRRLLPVSDGGPTGPTGESGDGRSDGGGAGAHDVAAAVELVRGSGSVAVAFETMDRYADDASRAAAEITHLDRTTVGEGLLAFPRTYMRWALEAFIDPRVLAEPLSAHG
jgi:geranylgeranyl pyrophosphate synthase